MTRRGWSLLEVSVALATAALLAAAALPTLWRVSVSARVEATVDQLRAIKDALQRYRLDQGAWPLALADLRGRYLPQQASLLSPWGSPYTLTPGSPSAAVSVTLPVPVPGGAWGLDVLATPVGGGAQLTIHVPPTGAAADLQAERCRLTAVCGN